MARNSLTNYEVSIVKQLLKLGKHSKQEIAGLINRSRGGADSDVSSGRITNIDKGDIAKYVPVKPASKEEVEFFMHKLLAFDPKTGLNLYDDERLIRAREAMILAVQVYNSPTVYFKTEVFSMLANVAWTYLIHEYYIRKEVCIEGKDGKTIELSKLLRRDDCPLPVGVKKNLEALKEIRDSVEHKLFRKSDVKWLSIYQACCLNFDKWIVELFGKQLSLQHDLSFALQFSKISIDQIAELHPFDVPAHIEALDKRLDEGVDDAVLQGTEYKLRVVYTLDSASKKNAHIKFVSPDTDEGKEIRNVLVKHKPGDDLYPHKPGKVSAIVSARSGVKFTTNDHSLAWKYYKVRPVKGSKNPQHTKQDFCMYHIAHGDYTYSDKWVDFLIERVSLPEELRRIRQSRQK